MQKIQIWLNDSCCKTITVAPSTSYGDVIRFLANQYDIPKRALPHLEVHLFVDGKGSIVSKEERVLSHTQSLLQRGIDIDDNGGDLSRSKPKCKYMLIVNEDAIKKAQKRTGSPEKPPSTSTSTSLSSFIKKKIGHQRSISLPTAATTKTTSPEIPKELSVPITEGNHSSKHNKSPRALIVVPPPIHTPAESILDSEKMPATTPSAAPHLTPRASISPPRATFRARSKTISQSLSSSDLTRDRSQEAINHLVNQKSRNRSSLGFDHPPLADLQLQIDSGLPMESLDQASSKLFGSNNRAGSPPPPQRLYVSPPTIATPMHITRQRSYTTSTMFPSRPVTPTKGFRASFESATGQWLKHESKSKTDEYRELLDVVERLRKAL